jgi:hypothetical protein
MKTFYLKEFCMRALSYGLLEEGRESLFELDFISNQFDILL